MAAESFESEISRVVSGNESGVTTEEICKLLSQTPQVLGDSFESLKRSRKLYGFAGLWISAEAYSAVSAQLVGALGRFHADHPRRIGCSEAELYELSGMKWDVKPFNRLIKQMASDSVVVEFGTELRLAGVRFELSENQRLLLERVAGVMDSCGALAPTPRQLAEELQIPLQAVEEMIRLGIASGDLIEIETNLVYPKQTIEKILDTVRELPSSFSVAEFRDATQSSRRLAIALLEFFDRQGWTVREGDSRRVAESCPEE